jgi:hypothetical protein
MVTIARQRPADRRNVALPPLATDSRSSPRFRAFCVGDRIEYFRGNPTSVIGSIVPMRWIVRKLAIETAPLDEDIALEVTEGRGAPYCTAMAMSAHGEWLDQFEEGNAAGGHASELEALRRPAVSPSMTARR